MRCLPQSIEFADEQRLAGEVAASVKILFNFRLRAARMFQTFSLLIDANVSQSLRFEEANASDVNRSANGRSLHRWNSQRYAMGRYLIDL
jgi:hypothetical protein